MGSDRQAMKHATFEQPAACDVALWIIHHRPGITEGELAEEMYGERSQPRVNGDTRLLEGRNLIERRSVNGPLRLYPVKPSPA